MGITFAQRSVARKSNEIPAVQKLLEELDISGCLVVADALNCQKKTAKIIIEGGADYLLCTKDNQETLKKDVEDYIQDKSLQKTMDTASTAEKIGEGLKNAPHLLQMTQTGFPLRERGKT